MGVIVPQNKQNVKNVKICHTNTYKTKCAIRGGALPNGLRRILQGLAALASTPPIHSLTAYGRTLAHRRKFTIREPLCKRVLEGVVSGFGVSVFLDIKNLPTMCCSVSLMLRIGLHGVYNFKFGDYPTSNLHIKKESADGTLSKIQKGDVYYYQLIYV